MCFHKRLLFACSHYAWLMTPESIIPCGVERRFMRGAAIESDNDSENETMSEIGGDLSSPAPIPEEGCGQMWSHGFYTIKVGDDCRSCVDKKRRRESRIVEVKEVIRSLRVNLERMGSGGGLGHGGVDEECGYDNDEEEGEEEKGREEWGLTVRSKNSDSTRTSGATGLDLTSSPGGWSKTGTGDTSLSLDSEHKRDRGLAKESLMEDENDEDEIENERMEEEIIKGREIVRKNERFFNGREIASTIPEELRTEWRDRWRETGSYGYEYDFSRKLMTRRREPLLPLLVSVRRRQTLSEPEFNSSEGQEGTG